MAYTAQQLQQMARTALAERDRGNVLWDLLLVRMMLKTGLDQRQVEARIKELAAGVMA